MPKFAANLSWLLQDLPMPRRLQAACDLGFEAVECRFPYEYAAKELAGHCDAAGLEFVMFNAPPGDMQAGEYGISCLPGRKAEFEASIEAALAYAATLRAQFVHVLAGKVPPNELRERYVDVYVENLSWACAACEREGVGVLIEPINTYEMPGYLTSLTAHAIETMALVDNPNLGIQYDFHNAQLMEGSITKTLEQHISSIRHMQIANVPGRLPPGSGELNFPYLFDLIDRLGYQGWVGCEYRPQGDHPASTRESLFWGKKFGLGN